MQHRAAISNTTVLNRFAALSVADADDAPPPLEADPDLTPAAAAAAGADPQARYLILQGQCLLAEDLRRQSAACIAGSAPGKWTLAAEYLRSAYAFLERLMGDNIRCALGPNGQTHGGSHTQLSLSERYFIF